MTGKLIEPGKDGLQRILEPFGSADPYYHICVEHLLDIGYLTLRRDWIPRKEISNAWAKAHRLHQSGSGEEVAHLRGKIRGAEYLS